MKPQIRKVGVTRKGSADSDRSAPGQGRYKNEQLKEDLRAYLLEQGADLVGFGLVEQLVGAIEIV